MSKTCKLKQMEQNLKPGFYVAVNGYYLDDTTKRVITVLLYKFCMIKHIFQKVADFIIIVFTLLKTYGER